MYHRTHNLRKWNKYFSKCPVPGDQELQPLLSVCVTWVNITCPYGHSNILYLRTCTIHYVPVFSCSLAYKVFVFCSLTQPVISFWRVLLRRCLLCSVENFQLYWEKRDKHYHGVNRLSCLERSLADVPMPESWFLTPMPCLRHSLLTKVEMRF